MTSPGFGSGAAMRRGSLHEFVETLVFGVHFGAVYGIDDNARRIHRPPTAMSRGKQPVVLVRRHQDELAAAMPRDFNHLALSAVLKFAEFALKLDGRGPNHRSLPQGNPQRL